MQERIQRITSSSQIVERLETSTLVARSGVEPIFFLVEGEEEIVASPVKQGHETGYQSPVISLDEFLFPQYTHQEINDIMNVGGLSESDENYQEKIGKAEDIFFEYLRTRATVHFHPDDVLFPSQEDFGVFDWFYNVFTACQEEPPLHMIARASDELDILVIDQLDSWDPQETQNLYRVVEQELALRALPRYLQEHSPDSPCYDLLDALQQSQELPPSEFFAIINPMTRELEGKSIGVAKFLENYRSNLTSFPEYTLATLAAVNRLRSYGATLLRYNPINQEFTRVRE